MYPTHYRTRTIVPGRHPSLSICPPALLSPGHSNGGNPASAPSLPPVGKAGKPEPATATASPTLTPATISISLLTTSPTIPNLSLSEPLPALPMTTPPPHATAARSTSNFAQ
ncbi:hypothetical protein Hypma_008529 [Hypsizygus marmoreus]|uniref:Uncharacterized protein n=1 Tax=Hypsizygus marmoreus TaxID=39966 RepID=A0A369JRB4_HYPMA|nr:hypothetical protein Hypma_008529 [Hypsizygus marmoreus]